MKQSLLETPFLTEEKIIEELFRYWSETSLKLKGNGVSKGKASGKAKVVRSFRDLSTIKDKDIIVVLNVSPNWSIVFHRISGVVAEIGSETCHAAVLAREWAIPCVTGVKDATRMIKDNDQVMLDGTSGEILVL